MPIKTVAVAILLLVLAAMGWRYRNADWVQSALHPAEHKPLSIPFDKPPDPADAAASLPAPQAVAPPPGPRGVRKCRTKAGEVIYTDNTCPPGAREQAITQGAVTVLPAQAAKPAPAGGNTIRDDLLSPTDAAGDLRARRIERIVNH